jgi:signal transduction histidine kinase
MRDRADRRRVTGVMSGTLFHTLRETWFDLLTAAFVGVAEVVGTSVVAVTAGAGRALDPVGYALLVVNAAPLAMRNHRPRLALAVSVGTAMVYTWLGFPGGFYTLSVALCVWAAVAAGHRIVAAIGATLFLGIFVVAGMVVTGGHSGNIEAPVWLTGWIVASFVLGEVSRSRRRYLEQVEQRALDAERTREEEARRRAGEERMRIARELHDVLAHNISMINVQSGVALHLLDRQPDQARGALVAINDASREALRELRATLGVLRGVDEAEPRASAPGLDHLDELVERARSAGLEVEIETMGAARPLPAGTDLAAFRIIQESLTNVTRHAAARHVAISIRRDEREVGIAVEDDGRGLPEGAALQPGNGLTGMRERAVAAGGELEAGPRPGGGFAVRARLPIEGTA